MTNNNEIQLYLDYVKSQLEADLIPSDYVKWREEQFEIEYVLRAVKDNGDGDIESATVDNFGKDGYDHYGLYRINRSGYQDHIADFDFIGNPVQLSVEK